MSLGLLVFVLVFLMRDAQVLALRGSASVGARLGIYSLLQTGAMVLMALLGGTGVNASRAWTERRVALACVVIQIAQLGIAWALGKPAGGGLAWVGWVLPSPVLVIALSGLSFPLGKALGISPGTSVALITLLWLAFACASSTLLNRIDNDADDRIFAGNFALLTSCTALVFVPGFF